MLWLGVVLLARGTAGSRVSLLTDGPSSPTHGDRGLGPAAPPSAKCGEVASGARGAGTEDSTPRVQVCGTRCLPDREACLCLVQRQQARKRRKVGVTVVMTCACQAGREDWSLERPAFPVSLGVLGFPESLL